MNRTGIGTPGFSAVQRIVWSLWVCAIRNREIELQLLIGVGAGEETTVLY